MANFFSGLRRELIVWLGAAFPRIGIEGGAAASEDQLAPSPGQLFRNWRQK
jgi:hypothetical protein